MATVLKCVNGERHDVHNGRCTKCDYQFTSEELSEFYERRNAGIKLSGSSPAAKRARLLVQMYGDECHYCGCLLTDKTRTLDHFTPLSKGGTGDVSNLRLACSTCNQRKADCDGPLWMRAVRARLCPKCLKAVVYNKLPDCCHTKWLGALAGEDYETEVG